MPSPFFSTTPRWALRYLLGTSNVDDIDAGFQALAEDVDNLPLSLLAASSSAAAATAVDGEMLLCTGAAQAVTLPASAKGMLGVRAAGTQTGANPVTVQVGTGSGQLIKGKGLGAGASSIPLGTVGASVVLLWDGANWQIISGERDTGWLPLTLPAGVTSIGSDAAAVRVRGDRAEFCGVISNGGATITNGTAATVPAAAQPASSVPTPPIFPAPGGSFSTGSISTSDIVAAGSWAAGTFAVLEGVSYRIN